MVLEIITENSLQEFDISDNPLNCCRLGILYPYPAENFSPYTCLKDRVLYNVTDEEPNPFEAGECSCNDADKLSCDFNCEGYTFQKNSSRCVPCPKGQKCSGGKVENCKNGTFSTGGQSSCKPCTRPQSNCKTVGACDPFTGDSLTCDKGQCLPGWYSVNDTCVEQTCLHDSFGNSVILEGASYPLMWNGSLTTFEKAQDSLPCPDNFFGDVLRICSIRDTTLSTRKSSILNFCSQCKNIDSCSKHFCENNTQSTCLECESHSYYVDNEGLCQSCQSTVDNCDIWECSDGNSIRKDVPLCTSCLPGFYFNSTNNLCVGCEIDGCGTCDANQCFTCLNGIPFNIGSGSCSALTATSGNVSSKSLSTPALVGTIVGCIVFFFLLLLLIGYCLVRRLRSNEDQKLLKERGAGVLNANDMGIMTDMDWYEFKQGDNCVSQDGGS
eukprot:Awhi_evm1s14572